MRLKDGTRRVVASSPDGEVTSGLDVPVESAAPARVLKWSAGPTRDLLTARWGAAITRDVGPVRLALAVEPRSANNPGTAKVGVWLRW